MKQGLHPAYNPVVYIDTSTKAEFVTSSTLTSKEKKVIDGVEHNIIYCEVTADTHPFWTGIVHRLDTAGRIDRFAKKYDKIASGKRKTRKDAPRKNDEE